MGSSFFAYADSTFRPAASAPGEVSLAGVRRHICAAAPASPPSPEESTETVPQLRGRRR